MSFLVLAAGFTFKGRLIYWTIYDFKKLFSKLAPWNMHLPTVHLQQRLVFVRSYEYTQKTLGNSFVVRAFAKRLSTNDILR